MSDGPPESHRASRLTAWWNAFMFVLALIGMGTVGYFVGWYTIEGFPSHEYQLRRLAVGERFFDLMNSDPPDGINPDSWETVCQLAKSVFSYVTAADSPCALADLNVLGQRWRGLDWQETPPTLEKLRVAVGDMQTVGPVDDPYLNVLLSKFDAAASAAE